MSNERGWILIIKEVKEVVELKRTKFSIWFDDPTGIMYCVCKRSMILAVTYSIARVLYDGYSFSAYSSNVYTFSIAEVHAW